MMQKILNELRQNVSVKNLYIFIILFSWPLSLFLLLLLHICLNHTLLLPSTSVVLGARK